MKMDQFLLGENRFIIPLVFSEAEMFTFMTSTFQELLDIVNVG